MSLVWAMIIATLIGPTPWTSVKLVPDAATAAADASLRGAHRRIEPFHLVGQLGGDQDPVMGDLVGDGELFEQVTGLGDGHLVGRTAGDELEQPGVESHAVLVAEPGDVAVPFH